ncbi:MAG: sugar transferase [Candidatus Latescibacterota bacterium]
MPPWRRQFLLQGLKSFDLFLMLLALALAAHVAYTRVPFRALSFEQFLAMRVSVANLAALLGWAWVWRAIFSACGLYRTRRLATSWDDAADVLKATTAATVVLGAAAWLFGVRLVTPAFLPVFWTSSSASALGGRLLLRHCLRWLRRRGHNLRHLLIVGTNPRALRLAQQLQADTHLGYNLLGFVDDRWVGGRPPVARRYELVASPAALPDFLRCHVVDEVIIALPLRSCHVLADQVAAVCREQGLIVRCLADIFSSQSRPGLLAGPQDDALLTICAGPAEHRYGWGKRLADVALAVVLLVLAAPAALLAAALIKLDSPGPVLFVQERLGLHKRRFRLYKFRTMVTNAEARLAQIEHLNEVGGPAFKMRNDPRITRVGRWLRKSSVDELPQLLNVLKGDMSLVGPRPLPVRDYEGFDRDWYRRRFSVLPGVTGLWQVNGRSSVSFERWMEMDMQYIDQWNPWLDAKILLKTIPAVLKGTGAA